MLLVPNFDLSESYEVRQIFALFLQLNCSKFRLKQYQSLRVTKIVQEIKFEGVRDESESKKGFQRQSLTKYLRHTTGKVKLLFFGTFLLALTKFSFWPGDWALGYDSVKFRHFPNFF